MFQEFYSRVLVYLSTLLMLVIWWHSKSHPRVPLTLIIEPYDPGIKLQLDYNKTNECVPLHFSAARLPKCALASYPGSGNTWHRHLIQQLTGKSTLQTHLSTATQAQGIPGTDISYNNLRVSPHYKLTCQQLPRLREYLAQTSHTTTYG